MVACPSCGSGNIEGARFCLKCGATLPVAPESWRQSGDLGQQQAQQSGYQSGGYAPPQTPPFRHPTYNPPQGVYQQPFVVGAQPVHPAVPALISFFFPGLGLLFVPGKAGLRFFIFAADVIGKVLLVIIYLGFTAITFGIGAFTGCCFLLLPLVNVVAGIHSYDTAAKASGGQFQPLLFK